MNLIGDARFAIRMLLKSPGFTTVAVLTLALGVAVNTAVFSWMDALVLQPLPGVENSRRLVILETITPSGERITNSYKDYRDYRDSLTQVSGVALFLQESMSLGDTSHIQRIWVELVSGNYFDVLGVKPFWGRFFLPEEQGDELGAYPVVVISHRLWRSRFNADPGVLGQTLRVNRRELTIVGVTPPEFCGGSTFLAYDVWMPITMGLELKAVNDTTFSARTTRGLNLIARLRPGVGIESARAEVAAVAGRLAAAHPRSNRGLSATFARIWDVNSSAGDLLLGPVQILLAVCIVVLLIVCANVANLLLARSVSRQKELGVRLALGAGRGRLVRQLLTETLVISAMGASAGVPLALWMSGALVWLLPPADAPIFIDVEMNVRILGFSVLTCMLATLASGTLPALLSGRLDLNQALSQGGRSGSTGAHSHRTLGLLVVSEIALATVALICTGLLMRSFRNASMIQPGFESDNVLIARFNPSGGTPEESGRFCRRLRERLESAPGIVAVTFADAAPLGFGFGTWHDVEIDGYVPREGDNMKIYRSLVDPGYFQLMRIPLLEGRDFSERDKRDAPRVIVVNESFARRFFQDQNPLGRSVTVATVETTVVGLVKDSKYFSPLEAPRPYFYMPFRQWFDAGWSIVFYLKTSGRPMDAIATLRREAVAIDSRAGLFAAMPLSEYTIASLYPQKVAATLLSVLSAISLLLVTAGLYGVIAYVVSERAREMGIRMALGARSRDVTATILRRGAGLTLAGVLVGCVAAVLAMRFIESVLVGVSATDPLTYGSAGTFLVLVALVACYLPARRAAKVDPMVALRCE